MSVSTISPVPSSRGTSHGLAVTTNTNLRPPADPRLDLLRSVASMGRTDTHAEAFRQTDGGWGYRRIPGPITDDMLDRHLDGGQYLGAYVMPVGETTRLAVLDLDDHEHVIPWEQMQTTARKIAVALRAEGLVPWACRSGGGRGVHLFCWWTEPQPARDARTTLARVLASVGLTGGDGGIEKSEVEIFPKQDAVAADRYGNLIALPFGRESVPLDDDMEPIGTPAPWVSSAPPRADAPRRSGSSAALNPEAPARGRGRTADPGVDPALVADALGHIDADCEYPKWARVGMGLKQSLGEDGFPLWLNWSRTATIKFKGEADLRHHWNSFKKTEGSVVTAASIFTMAREAGWTPPTGAVPTFSDEDLALRFAARHADDLRYTAVWGQWHEWDDTRWRADQTLYAVDLARACCREVAAQANKKRQQLASARSTTAVLTLSRADRRLAMEVGQWDRHPWLLATPGGTIDLRTGNLREADPRDYLTRSTVAAPAGVCPLWLQTLDRIFLGDKEMIAFVQRIAGYCLTGSVREEKLFFLYGEGRNGKGTLIETLGYALGDYATTVPMATLLQVKHPEHPTEIAKLCGTHLAIAAETVDGARWNAARIKQLTGGDKLTGRFMRQDYFDFMPTHKLVVSSNQQPLLGRVDFAMASRLILIPFKQRFGQPDENLKERLRAEAPGILAWAVQGCLGYQAAGLAVPASVRAATDEYLREQDDLTLWLEECCVRKNDPTGRQPTTSQLYASFRDWCERNGAVPGSAKMFMARLEEKGFKIGDRSHGERRVHGVRLLGRAEEAEDRERADAVGGLL